MKLVIDPACSWPEFTQENFVSAWKPNEQVIRVKIGGNNFTTVKPRRGLDPNLTTPYSPALNLAESMGVMRIYPCIA